MKHKVNELEGALLDAAAAMAEGVAAYFVGGQCCHTVYPDAGDGAIFPYEPSKQWAIAGPIIERERISLMFIGAGGWSANFEQYFDDGLQEDPHTGPTALVAAMRAYVASKFGEEVELP